MLKQDIITSTYLGMQFAVTVCIFGYIGYLLDKRTGLLPLFLLIFLALGFAAGMYFVIKGAHLAKDKMALPAKEKEAEKK